MSDVVRNTQKQKVPRIIQVLKVVFEVKSFPIQVADHSSRRTVKLNIISGLILIFSLNFEPLMPFEDDVLC
jgi:hypothetical protein